MEDTMREPWARRVLKYFVHGLFFSLLVWVLIVGIIVIGSSFVGVGLVLLAGGIFSLIALFVGLVILFGVVNSVINLAVWGDSMNWSIVALLIHGLGLLVALLIVNCVIVYLPQMFFPGLTTGIVMWIPANIVDGKVCRSIAEHWLD